MKKWSLALLLSLVLAGCNGGGDNAQEEKEPEKIRQVFLLYTEDRLEENEESIGTLSLMLDGKEEKIDEDVLDGQYTYLNEQDKVLYINAEHDLYEYKRGGEKTKLAGNASSFSDYDAELVVYQEEDGDLYVVSADTAKEKIASGVTQHQLIGEEIFYLKDDGSFLQYHIGDKEESEFASDVVHFSVLDDKGEEILFVSQDYALYYQDGEKEMVKVSADDVEPYTISDYGKNLSFLTSDGSGSYNLVSADKKGGEQVEIATNVMEFDYIDGYYYFVNDDSNLFRKQADDEKAEKLASDIFGIRAENGELYYMNHDWSLFRLDGDKSEKLASEVDSYDVTPDGDVIYLNEDGSLFVNEEKAADDVSYYSHFFGNLAFAGSDEKLYLMEDMGKKEVAAEELGRYSYASYQGETVYYYSLNFADLAGVWSSTIEGETLFVGLDKDGYIQDLTEEEGIQLEEAESSYHYLHAYSEDSEDVSFYVDGDGLLTLIFDGEELVLEKSDQAAADKYVGQLQDEKDRERVHELIGEYISFIEYAVTNGDMSYIENFLVEGSELYNELSAMVDKAYEQDEYLYGTGSERVSTEKTGENEYTVKTIEEFITGYDEEYAEIYETFEKTYTLKKIDDAFRITSIKEVKSDKEISEL